MNRNEMKYKIVVLGDSIVGKTFIIRHYVERSYIDDQCGTIGIDFKIKTIQMDGGKIIKLQIWDTSGNELIRELLLPMTKRADGIILIYDVSNEGSFYNLDSW